MHLRICFVLLFTLHPFAFILALADEVSESHQLFDYFANRKIPHDPIDSTGTEHTAHAATDLSADTCGCASIILNQHTLDHPVVVQTQNELVSAIRSYEVSFHSCGEDCKRRAEFGSQFFGQVGHFLKRNRPVYEDLPANLVDSHGWLFAFGKPGAQSLGRHIENAGKGRDERG